MGQTSARKKQIVNRTKKFQKEKQTASVDRTKKEETEWDKEEPERNRL